MTSEQNEPCHLCMVIIGFGVGWLAGLSVSPVVSTLITSLMAVIVTLASALSGLKTEEKDGESIIPRWKVDPAPIALLIVGIVIGSIAGIAVRTNNKLGNDLQAEIRKWEAIGIDKNEVAQRLFEREYSPKETPEKPPHDIAKTLLFSEEGKKECDKLSTFLPNELPNRLKFSTIEIFHDLPTIIQDPEQLGKVVSVQCEKLGQ